MKKYILAGVAALALLAGSLACSSASADKPAAGTAASQGVSQVAGTAAASPSALKTIAAAPAAPKLTTAQQNAAKSAQQYLGLSGFSRKGLIGQLKFDGYSEADATVAIDSLGVDWMLQATRSAKAYVDLTSFSRKGLISQLEFDGYTSAQAAHGADSVGLR